MAKKKADAPEGPSEIALICAAQRGESLPVPPDRQEWARRILEKLRLRLLDSGNVIAADTVRRVLDR